MISGRFGCMFHYANFPFDRSECRIGLSMLNGIIKLVPQGGADGFFHVQEQNTHLGYFHFKEFSQEKNMMTGDPIILLHFDRLFTFYAINVYIPYIITVSAAGFSLFLPMGMAPARAVICVSSLIAVILQGIQVRLCFIMLSQFPNMLLELLLQQYYVLLFLLLLLYFYCYTTITTTTTITYTTTFLLLPLLLLLPLVLLLVF